MNTCDWQRKQLHVVVACGLSAQNVPRLNFYFSPVCINRIEGHWGGSWSFSWLLLLLLSLLLLFVCLLKDMWIWIMCSLWKKKKSRHENSSSSVHLMICSQLVDQITSFFSGCAGQLMCWHRALVFLWRFNLSHPLCGCHLMFGWSWQDFCIHNKFFFIRWQVNLRGPSLLASVEISSWKLGFSCGCTCTTHGPTKPHREKKNIELRKCFH